MEVFLLTGWLAVRDRVMSPRTYDGPMFGVGVEGRMNFGLHGGLSLRAGRLTAAGLGKRAYSSTGTDPLTGETRTGTLKPFSLAVDAGLELGWERTVGAVLWTNSAWTGGYAFNIWAYNTITLGPQVHWTNPDEKITLDGRIGLASVVTRFPWSTNTLQPGKSQVGGFFASGTRLAPIWSHVDAQASALVHLERWRVGGQLTFNYDTRPAPLVWVDVALHAGHAW